MCNVQANIVLYTLYFKVLQIKVIERTSEFVLFLFYYIVLYIINTAKDKMLKISAIIFYVRLSKKELFK